MESKLRKDQVKRLNRTRKSADRAEQKLKSMTERFDLEKETKKQLKKDYGMSGGGKVTIARGSGAARPQMFRKNG